MIRYRVKTEQEFIEEYGYNWRNHRTTNCLCCYVYDMDYLLGTEISLEHPKNILTEYWFDSYQNDINFRLFVERKEPVYAASIWISTWALTIDMLKQLTPEYNNKKVLVYD